MLDRLETLRDDLESICAEEEEARDNIPESMQDSERYEKADLACDNLNYALDSIDEIVDYINEAME